MKLITTTSGAKYTVTKDGVVTREQGDTDIANTRDGYQYTNGHLLSSYSHVAAGNSFVWYGVINDKLAELIVTSRIVKCEIYGYRFDWLRFGDS